jgi:hypothetical protein
MSRSEISPRTAVTLLLILIGFVVIMLAVSGCENDLGRDPQTGKRGKPLGGKIFNDEKSVDSITYYTQWAGGNTPKGKARKLAPGSQTMVNDADGWCPPDWANGRWTKTGWPFKTKSSGVVKAGDCIKISDGEVVEVTVIRP